MGSIWPCSQRGRETIRGRNCVSRGSNTEQEDNRCPSLARSCVDPATEARGGCTDLYSDPRSRNPTPATLGDCKGAGGFAFANRNYPLTWVIGLLIGLTLPVRR